MSDSASSRTAAGNARQWDRWQMDELPASTRGAQGAAQAEKPANPQAELDALRARIRQQAQEEGRQAGLKAGQEEGRAAGYEAGYKQGLEQGQEEAQAAAEQKLQQQIAETLPPLSELVRNADQALRELDEDVAAQLVDLALAVGRQLAREALDAKPEQILHIVRELLHSDPILGSKPRLWLHPEDMELVQQQLGLEFEAAGWQLQPDDQLTRGGCRLTSSTGEINATWEERWQAIARQVKKRKRRKPAKNDTAKDQTQETPEAGA